MLFEVNVHKNEWYQLDGILTCKRYLSLYKLSFVIMVDGSESKQEKNYVVYHLQQEAKCGIIFYLFPLDMPTCCLFGLKASIYLYQDDYML